MNAKSSTPTPYVTPGIRFLLADPLRMRPEKTTPATTKPPPYRLAYTAKELATELGISTRSLRRLEKRGLLKPSRALRKKLYSAAAVAVFLEETS